MMKIMRYLLNLAQLSNLVDKIDHLHLHLDQMTKVLINQDPIIEETLEIEIIDQDLIPGIDPLLETDTQGEDHPLEIDTTEEGLQVETEVILKVEAKGKGLIHLEHLMV